MILKPSNLTPDNLVFSSSDKIDIKWKNNGDAMISFQVKVFDNISNVLEFDSGKIVSFTPKYTIPNDSLVNNKVYKYNITVFNSINESATSDFKMIRCYDRPVITIQTDGILRNQIASFVSIYSQSQSVSLKCFKYILYDEYMNVIEQSEYIYDTSLEYTFNNKLKEDTKYYVECIAIDQNDLVGTSGKVQFISDYEAPVVYYSFGTEQFFLKPYVRLTWSTVRTIGQIEGQEIYINDEKIDVRNSLVKFNEHFNIDNNFTLKLWFSQLEEGEILHLYGGNGNLTVGYNKGRLYANRLINGLLSCVSTPLYYQSSNEYCLSLQQIDGILNLVSEVI